MRVPRTRQVDLENIARLKVLVDALYAIDEKARRVLRPVLQYRQRQQCRCRFPARQITFELIEQGLVIAFCDEYRALAQVIDDDRGGTTQRHGQRQIRRKRTLQARLDLAGKFVRQEHHPAAVEWQRILGIIEDALSSPGGIQCVKKTARQRFTRAIAQRAVRLEYQRGLWKREQDVEA